MAKMKKARAQVQPSPSQPTPEEKAKIKVVECPNGGKILELHGLSAGPISIRFWDGVAAFGSYGLTTAGSWIHIIGAREPTAVLEEYEDIKAELKF